MNRSRFRLLSFLMTFSLLSLVIVPLIAQDMDYPLELCERGAFSTESGFSTAVEPYDGNTYVSDGDLLSTDGQVCARNTDLLASFDVDIDLGLDAVDILDIGQRLVAFSTELYSPDGRFSDGDLLITGGIVIPNKALLAQFAANNDYAVTVNLGLDAVQFIGTPDGIRGLIESTDDWQDVDLSALLAEYDVDIWFSIESPWRIAGEEAPAVQDGDILSAREGTIVVAQQDLLTHSKIPIPDSGAGMGMDALTVSRNGDITLILFSSEILYDLEVSFTDGDIVRYGGGILTAHEDLIAPLETSATFLGLDALWIPLTEVLTTPNIQSMCGRDHLVVDFLGGIVIPGSPGLGLYQQDESLVRPCGRFVPIDGYLPATEDIQRFRVAFRLVDDPVPPVGTAMGIQTTWDIAEWGPRGCDYNGGELGTDEQGWMDAKAFLGVKNGPCTQNNLYLAVWNTLELAEEPGPNGHYVLWMEWEDAEGELYRESFEHHLQLDNVAPVINTFELRLSGESDTPVIIPVGGEIPAGYTTFATWGEFSDRYFWNFQMVLRGGDPTTLHWFAPITADIAVDDSLESTGTIPVDTVVHLADIDLTPFSTWATAPCCYVLDLYVYDASIHHGFDGKTVEARGSSSRVATTFALEPVPQPEVTPEPEEPET